MSENKQYKTEWSFDFDKAGEGLRQSLDNLVSDVEIKTAHYTESVGTATAARVDLHLAIGEANVRAGTDSSVLFDADVKYVGEIEYGVSGDTYKTVKLAHKDHFGTSIGNAIKRSLKGINVGRDLLWNVSLTNAIPLDLNISAGVGQAELDLSALNLKSFKFSGGVGETILNLPTGTYNSSYSVGVGRAKITVAKGTQGTIKIEGGVGAAHITVEGDADMTFDIQGGVGETRLELPADAAVRITAEGGIGDVSVPGHYKRLSSDNNFMSHGGTWETPGYAIAQRRVNVRYKGGVGQLAVRQPNVTTV